MPVHLLERVQKVRLSEIELGKSLHRQPRPREVAIATGLSRRQVEEIQAAGVAVASLDKPTRDDQTTLGESMAAREPGPQEEVEQSTDQETLREALAELPEDERAVLELRYGFAADAAPQTVNQVHQSLDITRHRVGQLERHGLSRLAARREVRALAEVG